MHTSLRIALSATLLSSLFACGGGGGGATADTPINGKFVDAAVAGLTYTTATQSGTTDASGLFKYKSGETVTFKLYGQQISTVPAHTTLTPYDTNDDTIGVDYSLNLVRFLMAIDTDANPANGITLPTFTGTFNVNFNQDLFAFEADQTVASFLTTYAGGRSLATIQDAITHFMGSIASANDSYTLNVNGKTATDVVTNSYCSNNFVQGWSMSFSPSSVTMVGDDSFVTHNDRICTATGTETLVVSYHSITTGDLFDCAPQCSWSQLNRVTYVPSDADGRTAIVTTWHTPNTNKITSTKRIILDPNHMGQPAALSTIKDVITLN
ncbi:hypothetical protein [Limnohabitans sp.]|uniref:hypothetical protein n=1 Tax=Limnohabitans sp. TaxID=1907725 RepID=UPI00286EF243|nr:hypothetical protein [Limnohabitans sp.]